MNEILNLRRSTSDSRKNGNFSYLLNNLIQVGIVLQNYKYLLKDYKMGKKKGGKAGKWNKTEHERFIKALAKYGKNWSMIQQCVQTRSLIQVRSHAQKLFLSMSSDQLEKFEEQIAHRYDMFCNPQKKQKQMLDLSGKLGQVESVSEKVSENLLKMEISQKSDDSKNTQSKKLNISSVKEFDIKKSENNPPFPQVKNDNDLRAQILRSQSRISSIIDQLNQLPKLPILDYGSLLQLNMNIVKQLMWAPY